ncbi:MAG: hypothetical protein H0X26_00375 [Alphaproteobacteria bacterium]|nr:hypothetical protein [Alphaproteobacteria bacterium]
MAKATLSWGSRKAKMQRTSFPTHHNRSYKGDHIMTNYKLAYIEHAIQLLICKLENVQAQTGYVWRELDSIQADLYALSKAYGDWIVENKAL